MPYIGNTVQNQGFSPAVDYFDGDGTTVTFTLSRPVASVAQLTAVIENVIQNPSTAFNVSGNDITFTSAPPAGTNNIWVEYTSLVTTYAAISQDPSVIGDITATGGYLAEGDFGNSFIDGTIVDYVSGIARITTGPSDGMVFYNGGTSSRTAMGTFDTSGNFTNNATGYTKIAVGTTAQRPSSPTTGMIRFNTTLNYLEEYRGGQWVGLSGVFSASGGTETTISSGGVNYKVHTFTSSGAFTVLSGTNQVQYLVIAGGGASGGATGTWEPSAGGGAGGYRCSVGGESSGNNSTPEVPLTLGPGSYSVVIGAGGAGQAYNVTPGNGSISSFAGVESVGGGGGGSYFVSGRSGGSGGGGAEAYGVGTATTGQGTAGAGGFAAEAGGSNASAGGGGGSRTAGSAGTSGVGGAGGSSTTSSINGSSVARAGGGGGGGTTPGAGGGGGAGNGTVSTSTLIAGTANTGSGGGGGHVASGNFNGANGGSGIVIIRYPI